MERKIIIPGEVIIEGDSYLPGEGTTKTSEGIVALRYGLAEESNNLIKVIPLTGVYYPRRGNIVIGKVENITFNGWVIDIGASDNGFLSLMKVPRVIGKEGSMISLIKEETGCQITVGQNGIIWIKGKKIDDEVFAKKAIMFIAENSFKKGLTEKIQEWFKEEKK